MCKDYEHPDITAACRTGVASYHKWHIQVDVTPDIVRSYIEDDDSDFIKFCMKQEDLLLAFIDQERQKAPFEKWVQEVLTG